MLNNFKESINRLFNDINYRILWIELLLFSVIFDFLPHLWTIGCLMFLGLSWVLSKPKGVLYMTYILSLGWGVMAMCVVYSLSGWGWATAWGMFISISSLGIHFRDLKQPLYDTTHTQYKDAITLESNLPWNYRNLN